MAFLSLSVVIPAHNEEECIYQTLCKVQQYLVRHVQDYEIIVVEDGCEDLTHQEIERARRDGVRVKAIVNEQKCGKGHSVRKGVFAAQKKWILFLDADLSTTIDEVSKVMIKIQNGVDVIIGSREHPESDIAKPQGFCRRNMGRVFNVFVQIILFRGIRDTQCGFKCFRADLARKLFQTQTLEGFCFDVELLFLARMWGYRIEEIPVRWMNRDASKVGMFRDSVRMFRDLFLIRWRFWKGEYGQK